MNTPTAKVTVIYNEQDISKDISDDLKSLTYSDKSEGESDELRITLDDSYGKWRNNWYPEKGDTIEASIQFRGQVLKCGVFEVDEIESTFPPDEFTISALAAGITDTTRSRECEAYDDQSLRDIVEKVAGRNGFDVIGTIPDIQFTRITQENETDLAFMNRLAIEYGMIFSQRGSSMVFTSVYDLETGAAVARIGRSDLAGGSIKDKTSDTYASCKVRYHDPAGGQLIEVDVQTEDITNEGTEDMFLAAPKNDQLLISTKCESAQQAEAKAKAALYRANSRAVTGNIDLSEGNCLLVSGVSFELVHIGVLSGKYYIESSDHSVDGNGGYTTGLEIKKTATVPRDLEQTPNEPIEKAPLGSIAAFRNGNVFAQNT